MSRYGRKAFVNFLVVSIYAGTANIGLNSEDYMW